MKSIFIIAIALFQAVVVAVTPKPGALSAYLNVTSLDHIFNTFVPALAKSALNNKTFDLNITESSYLYKFTLNKLQILNVTGFNPAEISYIPNTDQIRMRVGGITVNTAVDADFEALHFIPFRASGVSINDLAFEFVVDSKSSDQVHFELVDSTSVTLGGVIINMNNAILDELVYLSRSVINSAVRK